MAKRDLSGLVGNLINGVKEEEPKKVAEALTEEETAAAMETIHAKQSIKRGRPKKEQRKLESGYLRTSLIVDRIKYDKLREISLREGLTLTETFTLCMDIVIDKYEKAHGEVKPREERIDLRRIFNS